ALTAAVRYLTDLLHVEVDQLPWPLPLVSLDRTRRPVKAGEDAEASAAQHAVDGGGGETELPGNAMRPAAELTPETDDRVDNVLGQSVPTATGLTGAV